MPQRKSFSAQLEDLQQDLLKMGTAVEEAIHLSVKALEERDLELAQQVIEDDHHINDMELEIEEACLRLLALQQPMAKDLRVITTALKIITDLERMADSAVGIARIVVRMAGEQLIKPLIDIPRMAEIAEGMTRDALTAYIETDADLAREMVERDHRVDELYNQIFRELILYMIEDAKNIRQATRLLFVAKYLERIGDHATNVGEWIIYLVSGERVELND